MTGASGFVGRALLARLASDPLFDGRGLYRTSGSVADNGVPAIVVGDLSESPDFDAALRGVDVVIHTAARTHVVDEREHDPLAAYRKINVTGTLNIAKAAAVAGARRFVFLSSVKVNGESTPINRPFTEADPPAPLDFYGQSKWEAEQALWKLSAETGMEVVVLRPTLIYGQGVKGNLRRLIRLVERGLPLPLGAVANRRSMIGLDNLVSAILATATHPAAADRTFLVSDQDDLSTPDLLRAIATGLARPLALWPVPVSVLTAVGNLLGWRAEVDRLANSLLVDSTLLSTTLSWRPETSVTEGIRRMLRAG